MWGVWVEIKAVRCVIEKETSHPVWGVWVEMLTNTKLLCTDTIAPYMGVWVETLLIFSSISFLSFLYTWEHELKYRWKSKTTERWIIAPCIVCVNWNQDGVPDLSIRNFRMPFSWGVNWNYHRALQHLLFHIPKGMRELKWSNRHSRSGKIVVAS